MSKYTTEVRFICEQAAGRTESAGYTSVNEIIQKSLPKIFDFDFPIFDEDYRVPLETKIIKHYYTREIGAETVGLWKLWLDQTLNEIMPYYNEKYTIKKKALEMFHKNNLFNNVDLTTTRDEDISGTTDKIGNTVGKETKKDDVTKTGSADRKGLESESHNDRTEYTGVNQDAYSDTPQSSLNGVNSLKYLTNYRKVDDSNTTINSGGSSTTTTDTQKTGEVTDGRTTVDKRTDQTDKEKIYTTKDYIEKIIGKNGGKDYMTLYKQAYESITNIDMEIIESLSNLFFSLW